MATHDTPPSDGADDGSGSTRRRATARLEKRTRDGSLATVAGGAALLWAARTIRKNAGRATLLALAGAALIGVGRRQRGGGRDEHGAETAVSVSLDEDGEGETAERDEKQVSDDAHSQASGDLGAGRNADESESSVRSAEEAEDTNPRGVADDEALERDDGGEFDFVNGEDHPAHREPHLEAEGDQDPRLDDEDDDSEPTEIDLSESSLADEASEAAGPQSEQAFPSMEGTDPEPQSPQAPPRSNEVMESSEPSDAEVGEDAVVDDESADVSDGTREEGDESTEVNGESTEANGEPTESNDASTETNGESGTSS